MQVYREKYEGNPVTAVWKVRCKGEERVALGAAEEGPQRILDGSVTMNDVYGWRPSELLPRLQELVAEPVDVEEAACITVLAPIGDQDIWAAGVTYERSRQARGEESNQSALYDAVYLAERPELFLKQTRGRVRGPDQAIGIRSDSVWDVPEPELAVAFNHLGEPLGYTIGNDVSSRSIEGENPLYLPQAKIYRGSCAIGPCLVPVSEAPPLEEMTISLVIARHDQEIYNGSVSLDRLRRTPTDLARHLFREDDFPIGLVLLTGTGIVPDDWSLEDGDNVVISVDGLGALRNHVVRSTGVLA